MLQFSGSNPTNVGPLSKALNALNNVVYRRSTDENICVFCGILIKIKTINNLYNRSITRISIGCSSCRLHWDRGSVEGTKMKLFSRTGQVTSRIFLRTPRIRETGDGRRAVPCALQVAVRDLRVSRCTSDTPGRDDPTPARAPGVGRGSSRRTRPDRRPGSDGWTDGR